LALMFGAFAALGNLLGGIVLAVRRQWDRRFLRYFIAVGAGFMLAAVILRIIPESIELMGSGTKAGLFILIGYLLVHFSEHVMASHFHFGEETHEDALLKTSTGLWAVAGLAIHAFFDGVSIASGFFVSSALGVLIFFAVILHKLPEGFTVASIMLASGKGTKTAVGAAGVIALATLMGTVLMSPLRSLVQYSLALSAGVTIYVGASDLIPEANEEKGVKMAAVVIGGVLIFYLAERALGFVTG